MAIVMSMTQKDEEDPIEEELEYEEGEEEYEEGETEPQYPAPV